MARAPVVSYEIADRPAARFRAKLHEQVVASGARRVVDIGGGSRPALEPSFLEKHRIDYTILDISEKELDKAPSFYQTKMLADIADPTLTIEGDFDLAFSSQLAEHVVDPRAFHRNVRRLLAADGLALHFFPTMATLPYIANRLFPEGAAHRLLKVARPGMERKFPAYYRWCWGPTSGQFERLREVGYVVEEYHGFFGHRYYARVSPLHWLEETKSALLLRTPISYLTSYAWLVLRASTGHTTRTR